MTRFDETETQMWTVLGVEPIDHRLHMATLDIDVRVQEVGLTTVARRIPDARLHLLDRTGHAPWLDEPDRCAAIAQAFLPA